MDQQHYAPFRGTPNPLGSVTNFNWNTGGSKTSADSYATYVISAFKHWYVYRRKPKWFGQFEGDRYLGRLRWISHHCDGKQWRNITQRGSLDGYAVKAGSEKESDRIARDLMFAVGYIRPWFYPELRQQRVKRTYNLGIRCADCGITKAEVERDRDKRRQQLSWPETGPRMEYWDARDRAKREINCRCK